jgi:hypothetical protein
VTDRQLHAQLLVRLQNIQPSHDRALIVCRSAPVHPAGPARVLRQLEARVLPPVLIQCGLNVVVAVNKQRFLSPSARDLRASVSSTHLVLVISELADDNWRQVDVFALELVLPDRPLLGLHAE